MISWIMTTSMSIYSFIFVAVFSPLRNQRDMASKLVIVEHLLRNLGSFSHTISSFHLMSVLIRQSFLTINEKKFWKPITIFSFLKVHVDYNTGLGKFRKNILLLLFSFFCVMTHTSSVIHDGKPSTFALQPCNASSIFYGHHLTKEIILFLFSQPYIMTSQWEQNIARVVNPTSLFFLAFIS